MSLFKLNFAKTLLSNYL